MRLTARITLLGIVALGLSATRTSLGAQGLEACKLITAMSVDRAADILRELDEPARSELLGGLAPPLKATLLSILGLLDSPSSGTYMLNNQKVESLDFAEYIRRLVARDVSAPRKLSDPSVLFALGASGGSDVAREKDEMVGQALPQ